MLKQLYDLGLRLYAIAIRLAAGFHPKAKLWVRGRQDWRKQLSAAMQQGGDWIWIHAASLGEFEQARPLIELIKAQQPQKRLLISFFSPSGYEVRKDYPLADYVCYLPMDHPTAARDFLHILQPELVIFIKYELWLNYLFEIKKRHIPAILVAASLNQNSSFLTSPLAPLYRKGFRCFEAIFTQDPQSVELLEAFSQHPQVISSRDTRYDRVWATQQAAEALPKIADFVGNRKCIVAGSSWPKGEKVLLEAFNSLKKDQEVCLIIAPHEINHQQIQNALDMYPEASQVFSDTQLDPKKQILWIDSIGLLSRLYRYADVAYIGGALGGHGLHNILEATAFGVPVLFGPKYEDKPEALALLEIGGAFVVENETEMLAQLRAWCLPSKKRSELKETLQNFVENQAGASQQVWAWIKKRLADG